MIQEGWMPQLGHESSIHAILTDTTTNMSPHFQQEYNTGVDVIEAKTGKIVHNLLKRTSTP
jgi:hypothetical protein